MTGDVRLGQIRYWLYTACVQLYLLAARAVRSPAKFCRAARGTREEGVHLARRGGGHLGGVHLPLPQRGVHLTPRVT